MKHASLISSSLLVAAFSFLAVPVASAHGEADESVSEFHEHLDDYRGEIVAFVDEADSISRAYAGDENVQPMIDELIERWEDIAVHDAIETHVPVVYPGIWQAIIGFQQATMEGESDDAVADAADNVAASLWQAFGALRLAATQVDEEHHAESGDETLSGGESIDRIVAELESAVEHYAEGEANAAESMIHDAYMQRFEYLEGDLIEADAELVTQLEKDFNATLPMLMQQEAPVAEVRKALDSMKDDLARARELLVAAEESRSEVF
ncbi:MAG: hypothetical protein ACNS61_03270 [Candidatus Wenzhouxiangella sp. M2_3B_020]